MLTSLGFPEKHIEHQGKAGLNGKPDIKLHIAKDAIVMLDAKKRGELIERKRNAHLLEKARYVRDINLELRPRAGGAGFGMLSDGEMWILFEVKPLNLRLVNFDYVHVLLQFEASTANSKELLEKSIQHSRFKGSKRSELEKALEMVDYQVALTNAVLPRLAPKQMVPFFEFLSRAHAGMKWEQFEHRMNQGLPARREFFSKKCNAAPEDLAVINAIYGNARFAVEMMKHIICDKTLQLPH